MSILGKNGDSERDQIEKFNFFLELFSDFDRDYEIPITTSRNLNRALDGTS